MKDEQVFRALKVVFQCCVCHVEGGRMLKAQFLLFKRIRGEEIRMKTPSDGQQPAFEIGGINCVILREAEEIKVGKRIRRGKERFA